MVSSPSINLVKGRRPHFLDQFIGWALTIGRIVVIITELIALGAFLYRFGLDRQLVDLHDKIVQEQNIVNFLKKNEDTYRNVQNRLILASNIVANEDQTLKIYEDVTALVPQAMSVQTVTFSSESMKIDASIQSVSELSTFITNLKAYPSIVSVSLDKIEDKTATGIISVTVTAFFKPISTKLL